MGDDMISVRFRMEMPDSLWTTEVSTSFPETRFRLLAGVPTPEGAMCLGEIVGDEATAASEAIRCHSDIIEYDELYSDTERSIVQYKGAHRQLFDFFGNTSVPPQFPSVARNGEVELDLTVTRDQFDALGDSLDANDYEYDIISVVSDRESESVLTTRQRECLAVALRQGYFRVPRECTLEDVADQLNVDKSTASKTIRRGTARVLEWFLVAQNHHTGSGRR